MGAVAAVGGALLGKAGAGGLLGKIVGGTIAGKLLGKAIKKVAKPVAQPVAQQPPTKESAAVQNAQEQERKRRLQNKGRSSLIKTGGQGVTEEANTARPTLLGQ